MGLMWTSGITSPETATAWGSPATLTWGICNISNPHGLYCALMLLVCTGALCTLFVLSSVGERKWTTTHVLREQHTYA